MRVITLASGSKGNSILVESAYARLLVDVGISCQRLTERLNSIAVSPPTIDAILITHEHMDHIRGLIPAVRKYRIPLFISRKTLAATSARTGGIDAYHIIESGVKFTIKDITIQPFSVSHDAVDPVAFTFRSSLTKVTVATDLGMAGKLVQERLKRSDLIVIEANHDEEMLRKGSYPWVLKQRIMSNTGHLSNDKCGTLLSEVMDARLKGVILAHLSEENNTPDLALDTVNERLHLSHGSFDSSILNVPSENGICAISI
jgi:phosphoribosyl 1,2-cyclic phosphodiesterase